MAGFRIAEGFIEVTVDDSRVGPQVQRAIQTAAVQSRTTAQNAGRHIGQHLAAGIRDGAQQGVRQAGQQGGDSFSQGFIRSASTGLKAGLAAVAVGAGAVFMQGFGQALEQGNVTSRLQAQLGATPSEAKKYGDIAGQLYTSGITDTFEEGANAIKGVMQQGLLPPDASNAQIKSIAGKVTDLSKTFDLDLGGATNAVSQLMKTGLAKNAQEALDIMTRGAQTGANKAGDLADTFNEYGTQFRKVGLDGKTAMGLLSQGLQAGARDADLVADSIKEFSIRAVDGSKTTVAGFQSLGLNADDMASRIAKGGKSSSDALDLTLDRLRGIKDPAERSRIAVQLFGTQAEDMGDALYALDPSKAVKTLGDVGGAADRMGKTLHTGPSHQIEVFKRTLQQNFVNFIGTNVLPLVTKMGSFFVTHLLPRLQKAGSVVGAVLGPALRGLGTALSATFGWIQRWQNVLVPLVAGMAAFTLVINAQKIAVAAWSLVTKGASAVTKAWTVVQAAFNAVMAMNPFVLVAAAVIGLGVALVVAYKKSETFRNIVDGAFRAVGKAWDWVWEKLKQGFALLKNLFMNFSGPGLLIKHWDTIKTKTKEAFEKVKGWVSTAITFIKNLFLNFTGPGLLIKHWTTIKTKTKEIWDAVKKKISDVLNGVKNTISTTLGAVKRLWSEAWTTIRDFFTTRWNNIKSRVSTAWAWLKDQFTKLKTAITRTWSDAWNAIKKKLTDIWSWISKKITDAFAWLRGKFTGLKDAITKTWSNAWGAIRTKLSDSWSWISNKVTDSFSSLRRKFTDVKNSITKTWSDAWGAVKSKTSDVVGSVMGKVNEFKDKVKTAFTTAKDGIKEAWDKVQGVVKKPVNYVIDPIYKSGIKGLWDKVAGFVGMDKLPSIQKLAAGGTVGTEPGVFNAPTAIVGEGNPHYPEYVIPTDPKHRKRALGLYEQAGTQLMDEGGILGKVGGAIKGGIGKVTGAASAIGGWMKDKAGDLAAGALEPFFKAGMKIVNGLLDKIPGVSTGMGKMMKALPQKYAKGIVSWLKGKDEEASGGGDVAAALKWARTQAGKPYQWGGAGNPSWDCSGFMGGIQKKIDGKNPNGRIWSTFSFSGAHAPSGWVRHLKSPFMVGITNRGKGHTAGTLGGVNVESRGGDGVLVGPRARGYRDSLFTDWYGYKPAKSSGGDWSAKGTGVARWRPHVIKELKHLGLSTGWQDTVLRRMNQESGGDPNVVNKWDSNWHAGHPSVGLMQVIRGTFDAYAGPHRGTGPKKYGVSVQPNANIHAGLNYANKRYGSLAGLNRPGGYDSGGWLPPGATLAINKTGKPEAVLTNEEAQTFKRMVQNPDQLGGVSVVINWSTLTLPSKTETRKLAVQLRDAIREVERARR
ncbi:phage tail tape measure protein [Streptomyces sp. FR-108]|uniref:phage tail tape measure protein n=1 Tax=Streptomyces sp. FR-108 TaxID=3416665 RepID=UPI003CE67573